MLQRNICFPRKMKIGKNIRKIRDMKGFSQDYMAMELGISPQAYSKIERERTKLDLHRLNLIAKLLDVEPKDIMDFDEDDILSSHGPGSSAFKSCIVTSTLCASLNELVQQLREVNKHLNDTNSFIARYLKDK
jgi:DNA-binding XRE family transcriptional regulator